MVCPFCLHEKTKVYNSRPGTKLNVMWRRRRCEACHQQFTTYENADPSSILKVADGKKAVPFLHTTLLISILRILPHRDDIDQAAPYLCDTIEQKLYQVSAAMPEKIISKADIIAATSETLRLFDPAAYVAYIAQHHQKHLDAAGLRRALRRKN